jgi:CheY-like chemotaxis protein
LEIDDSIGGARQAMTERDSRDRTVLIVEDVEDTRFFMRLALEQLGYVVFEAEDGEQAVAVAERERPDIILMDLSLPVMDGLAATERIRATDGMKQVTIIAVTAHQGTDFREGARGAGFDAYVTKPIDIDSLAELMRGLLPNQA